MREAVGIAGEEYCADKEKEQRVSFEASRSRSGKGVWVEVSD